MRAYLRRRRVFLPAILLILIPVLYACSDDSPTQPLVSGDGTTAEIGPDGGTITLDEKVYLYVPPGTVGAVTEFGLGVVSDPPVPPDGWLHHGSAFVVSSSGAGFSGDLAVAVEFDYSYLEDPDGVLYRPVRLHRLSGDGEWEPVDGAATTFPLALGATVNGTGTFAAFVDARAGDPGSVLGNIDLGTTYGLLERSSGETGWKATARGEFTNPQETEHYIDGGGIPQAGPVQMAYREGIYSGSIYNQMIEPGLPCRFFVPGGSQIPLLDQSVPYFAANLALTDPGVPGQAVDRDEPFRVTWTGGGPELIWLTVYGAGADGAFHFQGQMVPNCGESFLQPEDLARFEAGAVVDVFLQRTQAFPIEAPGYHSASYLSLESVSVMTMTVQ